ncbi:hypothetical protein PanWU01x14_020820, partial [Parasponia andersonii]
LSSSLSHALSFTSSSNRSISLFPLLSHLSFGNLYSALPFLLRPSLVDTVSIKTLAQNFRMESSKGKGPGQHKRFQTTDEDNKLIGALLEIYNEGKFKVEGNFKAGHLIAIERYLEVQLPSCGLKAKPHIESQIKTLKAQFYIIHKMLIGLNCGG